MSYTRDDILNLELKYRNDPIIMELIAIAKERAVYDYGAGPTYNVKSKY